MEVPDIQSARLELVSLSPAVLEALLAGRREEAEERLSVPLPGGWPDDDVQSFLRLRLDQMRRDPGSQKWLVRALVSRSERLLVGHAGFHGPPGTTGLAPGKVEIGYTVFPPFRRRGYATEAAAALLEWAELEGIGQFVASVSPTNDPSLAILRKLGFVRTGEHWDEEDGLEHVYELDRRARASGAL